MTARTKLKEQIRACTDCELCREATDPVPFYGPVSDVLIVGEAPGRREDAVGKPFVGPAGKLLWRTLARYGIDETDVMRANAVCCYPRDTRTPQLDHLQACRGNLHRQVKLCDPRWILALGRPACWSLFGNEKNMRDIRGQWYDQRIVHATHRMRVFATYHPAAVLRDQTLTRQWSGDLKLFSEVVTRASST